MRESGAKLIAQDTEYFRDNNQRIKGEINRIREVERQETEMIATFEKLIPKLQTTLENVQNSEITVESIQGEVLKSEHPEFTDHFIKYDVKEKALGDAIRYLYENDNLDIDDGLKIVRDLAKKQYSALNKKRKLVAFANSKGF